MNLRIFVIHNFLKKLSIDSKHQIVEKYFSNSVKSLMTDEIEVIINY